MTEPGEISDGYHTFNELYEHRHALFITLCSTLPRPRVWRSRLHADGMMFDGWFVMGIDEAPGKQITYHLPDRLWEETWFARTLIRAPLWDGHTPADVIERIRRLSIK